MANSLTPSAVGVMGGTFDPVHFGHLRPALECRTALALEWIHFIPVGSPPHRQQPQAAAAHRQQMLAAAIDGEAGFMLDDRELHRPGPSYMVDTLADLRQELGPTPALCLLLGQDAVDKLDHWHRWEALLDYAHLVVMTRPDTHPGLPDAVVAQQPRHCQHREELLQQPAGGVLFQSVTPLTISATAIRQQLKKGHSPRFLLPDAVYDYINEQNLYRADSP